MAPKLFLLSFICLIFIVLSPIGHAKIKLRPLAKILSSLLKNLEGCHKGNKTKGIHQLKNYLHQFGYLEFLNETYTNDDEFDDALESALKTYQQNYHLKPTGILDVFTVSKMITPRCGVPDIINGTNMMQLGKKKHESNSSSIHASVSHFTFFNENRPRWPPSKSHLTYGFLPNTPTFVVAPVASAFRKWASATQFTFSQDQNYQNADLRIGFYSGDHGDRNPFMDKTLAHAFAPTDGRFHYNADRSWSIGPVPNAFDLETVALHEIGHLLGLGHSQVVEAIMYSGIGAGVTKNLHPDDIEGINALYNG